MSPTKPKRSSLSEEIYTALRAEIVACVLKPGQEIYEGELAERFGVSKTPIREALGTLRRHGLVRVLPRRGYQIAPITLNDIIELFALRTVLEGGIFEIAAQTRTEEHIQRLTDLAQGSYVPGDPTSTQEFVAMNRDFHRLVAQATGNKRLVRLLSECLDELERVFRLGAGTLDITRDVTHDHAALISALHRQDSEEARRLIHQHIEMNKQRVIQVLITTGNELVTLHP